MHFLFSIVYKNKGVFRRNLSVFEIFSEIAKIGFTKPKRYSRIVL